MYGSQLHVDLFPFPPLSPDWDYSNNACTTDSIQLEADQLTASKRLPLFNEEN